jgi:uncharacterized membrane protein
MIETSHFHPMMVHFPIALVTFGYLAELGSIFIKKDLSLSKISLYLLVFGTLSAIIAYLTGQIFTADMSGAAEGVRSWHETFAGITLGLLLITTAFRSYFCYKGDCAKLKWFTFTLYSVATLTVSITGYLGGTLVYNYMMPL